MIQVSSKSIFVNRIDNLKLRVVVVGYKTIGESILVLFSRSHNAKEEVFYSILIDCYIYGRGKQKIDKIDEYLRQYRVKELSLLIWTHPHEDHTVGLKHKITKYCRQGTKIISAPNFYNSERDIIKLTGKNNKLLIDELFRMSRFQHNTLNRIGALAGSYSAIDEFYIKGFDGEIPVSVCVVAPIVSILDEYEHDGIRNKNPNEISLAILLCVDDMAFFFGGDSPNNHLGEINPEYLNAIRFVKIPHHASKTSDSILQYLNPNLLEVACATRYAIGRSDLPDKNVLDRYKQVANCVLVTGDRNNKNWNFGVAEFEYSFSQNTSPTLKIDTYGNSTVL